MQPYLLNEGQNSMFDGTYVAMSMLRWFLWKNTPLVEGLEDRIRSLDGMWEQTPGWGKPPVKKFEDVIDYYTKTKNEEGLSYDTKNKMAVAERKSAGDENVITSHPPILYGHVHMAKTGGASLNGIMANSLNAFVDTRGTVMMHSKTMNEPKERKRKDQSS